MLFIALNLHFHAAMLTGTVNANNSFQNSAAITAPLVSLNAQKASFVTEKEGLIFHITCEALSPPVLARTHPGNCQIAELQQDR